MKLSAEGPGWKADILVAGGTEDSHYHFYVRISAESEKLCWAAMDEVVPVFMAGRETFWRVRQEVNRDHDFATMVTTWKGFARFSVKKAGAIEHETYRPKDGTEVVFMGLGKTEDK